MRKQITVLYEDDQLLIIDKPAGLLTMPDRYNDDLSALSWAQQKYPEAAVAHRIDRDTSGVLCLVKDKQHLSAVAQQWEDRSVVKDYVAIVEGRPAEEGTIETNLVESSSKRGRMIVHKKGKLAVTHYKVREQLGSSHAVLDVRIDTGRMHQVRVHLQHIGCPLLVDRLYGRQDSFYLSSVKRKYKRSVQEERPLISRHTLHAAGLRLRQPVSGDVIQVSAPLPKDMNAVVKQLQKWAR